MDAAKPSFQALILRLHDFWSRQGCVILQPYDVEMGAGTFHPATTLRALGPKPWRAAYVQPSRRPTDGRYGENPNRLQHYYQYQVIMKPSPADAQDLLLGSYREIGLDPLLHDFRFVEDDWESPTLGAWGLGWEVWCDGMEVGQFTYFQQVGGIPVTLPSFEMTYGLERLAMYVQDKDNVFDLDFNGARMGRRQLRRRVPARRTRIQRVQFRICRHGDADPAFRRRRGGVRRVAGPRAGAAGLRPVHQGEPPVQSAGCARRDQRDRAGKLYRPCPHAGERLLRGVGMRAKHHTANGGNDAMDRRLRMSW